MSLSRLSGWLKTAFREPAPSRRRPRRVPGVEVLEARTVPAPLTVMNNADHGAGSLRAVLAAANDGDTIVFAHSVHHITLTTGPLNVTRSVAIDGPGANKLTVSGNGASRVFVVSAGATVVIDGLTVTGGQAPTGGGIDNAGNLTLAHAAVQGNQSVGGLGGGILNEVGATLTLTHSTLADNRAIAATPTTSAPTADVFGGGLLNQGTAYVVSCAVSDNAALGGSGPITDFYAGSAGGGIDNFGGAMLTVTDSTFTGNQAVGAAAPFGAQGIIEGLGGAVENNAGFDQLHGSTAIISDSTFTGNSTGGGTGNTSNGGALDNEGTGVTMTVTNCTITGNQSVGGPGANGETTLGQGAGGGIMNVIGTLTVVNSTIAGNQALGGDHATVTSDNPFTGAGLGGGVENFFGGTATLIGCTVRGNVARGGATGAGPGGSGVGGGIENSFSFGPGSSTLNVIDCTISDNLAQGGRGGPGAVAVTAGFGGGGGIDNSFNSVAVITGSTVSGNQAVGGDGGTGNAGGNGLGGAISVGLNALIGFGDTSSLTVNDSTLDHNLALGGRGGAGASGGDGLGGALYIFTGTSATVSHSTVEHNRAEGGARGHGGTAGRGVGGGVYNLGSFAAIATVIKKNHASTSNDDIFP